MNTGSSFPGFASHPDLRDAIARGTISFDPFRFHFVSADLSLEVPLVRLQIGLDQSAGQRIVFEDPHQPDLSVYTFDLGVLKDRALRQLPYTRNQIEGLESFSELKRRLKITLWFVAGFALVALGVTLLLGYMARSLVARIPPEFEQELGDSALAEIQARHSFVTDALFKAKLESAAKPLIAPLSTNSTAIKFYVMADRLPNAFALPGGHVVVTTRLLELTDQPAEIAAVVAHEVAHVRLKHSFRQAISSAGPYLVFSVFVHGGNGLMNVLGGSSQLLVQRSFSQEYELEADATGWDYLVAARIDPRGLIEILKKLEQEQSLIPALRAQMGAFSSHPATLKRIRRLEAKWRKLKDKSLFLLSSGANP